MEVLEQIDPWGQKRADYRAAVICWVLASVNYAGKGRGPQLKDFLKLFEFERRPDQSDEQIMQIFTAMAGQKK